MKRALVIGDYITDQYTFGHATRLCPEGPVPVIVRDKYEERAGGVGLVFNQLVALSGPREKHSLIFGSHSKKHRIFADDRLICRIDEDQSPSSNVAVAENWAYKEVIPRLPEYDLLIISDYGKGAFTEESAKMILAAAEIPILVDAKNNFGWYFDAFALFPNERETADGAYNVIRKLGPRGCSLNGTIIPLEQEHNVRDVTGAGDVFIAAFAALMLEEMSLGDAAEAVDLYFCARFANLVAARSVEFVGTHVVTDIRLEEA